MDFVELESLEGLRWSWNSCPVSRTESNALVVPLSIMQTPLMKFNELPILSYDPLICTQCRSILNPYARVDYPTRIWICPFCHHKNLFPKSYPEIGQNIPVELFPTYSTVEYQLGHNWGTSESNSSSSLSNLDNREGRGVVFVFVVDACSSEDEIRVLKNELLLIVSQLPENSFVGLIVFDSMVKVYELDFTDCVQVVVFHGERKLSSSKVKDLIGFFKKKQKLARREGFLVRVSEYEFNITKAIEDIQHSPQITPGHRPLRCTGAAISVAVGILEACSILTATGSRILVFTSGPVTVGPGKIVNSDLNYSIRNHRDINNGRAPLYWRSCEFYKQISRKLVDMSVVLDLFACSLDQIGATEIRVAVERSGGFMMLDESFESDRFRKCLGHIFGLDEDGNLNMCFDATIEIIVTKDVKICGAIGPCVSIGKKTETSSRKEIGEGGTNMWKLGTITDKTCITFFFQVTKDHRGGPDNVFFIQLITKYRNGNMVRKRVTTAARRWCIADSSDIADGFDQETAVAVMARLAVHETKKSFPNDVVRWIDKGLISFASKFGDYIPDDPSSFRLPVNFSLYPQFMYYLRRSQFIDVFNSSPDETAFFQMTLNRERVMGTLIMIQPSLSRYSLDGPPIPVVLDICSLSPDVILLFDSYFYVVIHYGSKIAHLKKIGFDRDPENENFRNLLEAIETEAGQLVIQRVPEPHLVRCEQHSSQARFVLAKLNPSVTHKSSDMNRSEVIMTDDVSLQVFIEHLQKLAVQS